ncbi:hypothetical protein [Streptomyces mirabilis]|uniref:hypothetical protein n=1 Tax=Streptomyces mirabilis TaxID=68239 RepID=UPI00369A04DD
MRGLRASMVEQARAAGLTVEYIDDQPNEPEMWRRFYQLWQPHDAELPRELGDDQAGGRPGWSCPGWRRARPWP